MKTTIKRNKILYYVYYYVMSGLVNVYKLFLRSDNNLILFVSYGGRHFSDSPRVIYEAMIRDERFSNYTIYWAFTHPDNYPDIPNRVNINSLKYFNIALRARCWVTNVIIERALNFKGINTFYFHTTHGVLCKLDGKDSIESKNFKPLANFNFDCCLASSEFEKYDVNPLLIEIEITEETTHANSFLVISILKKLKDMGLKILLDDFGLGFSNIKSMKILPIDIIKIDKSFIDEIVYDYKSREIVRAIISFGKALNLQVIAEGVVDAKQVEILKKMKCDQIQGFFYSKPIPKKEYESFLMNNQFEKKEDASL